MGHIKVNYDYSDTEIFGKRIYKEELEGLTVWDLDMDQANNIKGQIHLIMIDNIGGADDDLYFKHFSVPVENR